MYPGQLMGGQNHNSSLNTYKTHIIIRYRGYKDNGTRGAGG